MCNCPCPDSKCACCPCADTRPVSCDCRAAVAVFTPITRTLACGHWAVTQSDVTLDTNCVCFATTGVDTPGCDCGHEGMGQKWHVSCTWKKEWLHDRQP